MSAQLGHCLSRVDGLARLHLTDALTKRFVQSCSLFVVEVVATACEHLIEGHKVDDLTLGAIGRLVEYEASVLHVGSDRVHRDRSVLRAGSDVEARHSSAFLSET